MMRTEKQRDPENFLRILLSYACLLFFLAVQAAVSLRIILELLDIVPGAFFGLSGVLMVFSGTVCLMIKVLLQLSQAIDGNRAGDAWKSRMAAGCIVCFGGIFPAAVGFQDGMTALFYYKAVNLQILLPWAAGSIGLLFTRTSFTATV